MSRSASVDLTEGPVARVLVTFSFPILISNLLQTGYNLADMAIVGKFVGSVGLSAVSIGGDIMHVILLASNGFSNAAQIIISHHMGAKDRAAVNSSIGTVMSFTAIFSILLTVLMICMNTPVLRILNTPQEAWKDAVAYTVTSYFGIIFTFGYGLLGSFLRGMGDSTHPMLFITLSSVVNIVLDLLFVGLLSMGAMGAALATVMGQGMSFVWSIIYVCRHSEAFGLSINPSMLSIKKNVLTGYIRLAIPMCLQKTLIQVANLYVNSFIYAYGVTVSAINGIGTKLGTLSQMFSNAMLQGGSAMVGQNIGAGRRDRVRQVVYINMLYGLGVWLVISGVTVAFREQIFGIFTSDELVLEMSKVFLPALVLRYLMFCTRCPFMALINGIGKPKINYILGVLDGLVLRVGCSLLLGIVLNMGVQGFWLGNALGGFGPLFVGSVYFFGRIWEKEALTENKKKQHGE